MKIQSQETQRTSHINARERHLGILFYNNTESKMKNSWRQKKNKKPTSCRGTKIKIAFNFSLETTQARRVG